MANSVNLTILELKTTNFHTKFQTINLFLPLNIDLGSKYIYLTFVADEV